MIGNLSPYPQMKESGIDWLGHVPQHWQLRRLRASVDTCTNGVWGDDPDGRDDLVCVRVADFDRICRRVDMRRKTLRAVALSERRGRLLNRGDLLIEKSGGGDLQPVGTVVMYDHDVPSVCSNFVARMPVAAGFDPRFLTYVHSCMYDQRVNVRSIKQTTGIQNLDSSRYLSERAAFPPLPEQAAIVRFLDHADRRIRRYIRAKQKLIALLEEQKQAIIHQAVTGQIDVRTGRLHSGYNDSGVDWLDNIPQHWNVVRLKFVAEKIVDCLHETPKYSDKGDFPAIRTADISPGMVRLGSARRIEEREYMRWTERLQPLPYDILYSREGERFGIAACVPEGARLCISQRMMVFRIRSEHNPVFVMWALNSRHVYAQACQDLMGSTAPHVNVSTIRNFAFAIPSRNEQDAVVESIGLSMTRLNGAIAKARDSVARAREYQSRIVSDVVTGRLDVRECGR